jgi:predicted AlkP superfamily pyrophosphatase or phosphodiesterase
MTVVVLGIDALDPDIVDAGRHPHLSLEASRRIETIESHTGEPSTHELWPTIITGLEPEDHGIQLADGVEWESSVLNIGSNLADMILPGDLRTRIGAWLLTNTTEDAFRTRSRYYEENNLETLFDGPNRLAIGVPNYVTSSDRDDREHELRSTMGALFQRDSDAVGGHKTADLNEFYEQCMEMVMTRIMRARRGLRSHRHSLVFSYTSGLDLIGHVAYGSPEVSRAAYHELNDFVGDLRGDLEPDDLLLLVSDHGLQKGVHTSSAMISSSDPAVLNGVDSVVDVREAIEAELREGNHRPTGQYQWDFDAGGNEVEDQLESLGYL